MPQERAFAQNLKRARLLNIYNHPFKKLQSEMKDHDLEDVPIHKLQKSHGDFLHKLCATTSCSELSSITGATSHFHTNHHWAPQISCFKCQASYFITPYPRPWHTPALHTDLSSRDTYVSLLDFEGWLDYFGKSSYYFARREFFCLNL